MNQLARMRKSQCILSASKLKSLKVLFLDIPFNHQHQCHSYRSSKFYAFYTLTIQRNRVTITGQSEQKHTEKVLSHCNCDNCGKLDVYIVDRGGRPSGVQRIVQCPNLNVSCSSSSTQAQISPFQNDKDSLYLSDSFLKRYLMKYQM